MGEEHESRTRFPTRQHVPDAGYTFEPNPAGRAGDRSFPQYIDYQIYQMILGVTRFRAQCADGGDEERYGQCESAHQRPLTLEYNKLRQAAITNELLEITTAMLGS